MFRRYNYKYLKTIIVLLFIPLCIIWILPIWTIFISSFTKDKALGEYGYQLWPKSFSLEAYEYLFVNPGLITNAYLISMIVTTLGTVLGVFFMSMLAYTIAHPKFKFSRFLGFYVLFTMLFSGGVVPYYILVTQYLHLKNTIYILILPYLMNPFCILLLRTYFKRLPLSIFEAAEIDGAGEFQKFFKIALPLSIPAIATVSLFIALIYWNDMYQALLFIDRQELYPLPYLLYRMIFEHNIIQEGAPYTGVITPYQSVRMAMAVLSMLPELVLFLLVQKFFIRGITLGSLKGE